MAKDLDDYRAVAKQIGESRKQEKYKPRVGDNTIRLLKTPRGKKSTPVIFTFAVHNEVGADKAWLRCGIDPISGEGKCWICQKLIPKLEKQGKESRASKLQPERRIVTQIADIHDDGKWTGPHLYYPSSGKATELTTLIQSKRRDYVDPKKGYNLGFTRTGTGKNDTRYGAFEPDDEPSKVPSSIMEKLKPFDALTEIPAYSEEKQKTAYYGEDKRRDDDDEDDEDEDGEDVEGVEEDDEDDDGPKKKSSKKSKKSKAKSRDDDDEDDEDDDDSDDEEDDEDDDDEDDEEDDDDDEDEKPRKKSKSKSKKSRR